MKISRSAWIHISLSVIIAVAALFLIRMHNAGGALFKRAGCSGHPCARRPYGEQVKMSRSTWIHIASAVIIALVALFFIRPHDASGAILPQDSAAAGHRLAEAWCKECHAIEATPTRERNRARRISPTSPPGRRPRRFR